jgi:peptidoglycan/xylan/chitin deacetylase (PgdA/CDA1 family)
MFKSVLRVMTMRRKLSILIYHQVLADFDPMRPDEMDAVTFEQHMSWLKDNFTVLTLSDAVSRLKQGTLPANASVVTFDDGYENNASVALPILQKLNLSATFFIASDFLNGGAMWNDKVIETVRHWPGDTIQLEWTKAKEFDTSSAEARTESAKRLLLEFKYLPLEERASAADAFAGDLAKNMRLMMSDEQVVELHKAGMEIGGHTCSHPILATLDDEQALAQIANNKHYLENLLGESISSFAYPNGRPDTDYTLATKNLVAKAGYDCAVSTSYGISDADTDWYQIPRFTPWRNDKFGFLSLLVRNYFNRAKLTSA